MKNFHLELSKILIRFFSICFVKMSEVDNGISRMAGMLNITRIHNALTAVSNMRRFV